jgi:putative aldouronate transport system substrate-binding protein
VRQKVKGLLLVVLIISLIAGCTNNTEQTEQTEEPSENFNAEGFPIVEESIELKMMGSKNPIQGEWSELAVFKELTELTNINFTFDTPADSSYEEKKNLAFATEQIPDVFFGGNLTAADEVNYGQQGYLIPLEDLIAEHAPNFKKLMDEDPAIKSSITTTDGHIYALPQITAGFGLYPKLWINKKWMETIGLEEPQTIDDFYNVLKAFKEEDPNQNGEADEIPLTAHNMNVRHAVLAAYGYVGETVDVIDGKVVYVPIQEGYKEYLTFMNKLYKEELFDHESFTQNPQQIVAKGNAGRLGAFNHAGPFLAVGVERNEDYVQLKPLTSELSSEPVWPKNSDIRRGAFAITKDNPNPQASIRLVDYLYSKEGSILMAHGVEGENWEQNEEGGFKSLAPEGMNHQEYKGGQVSPDAGTVVPLNRRPVDEMGAKGAPPTNAFIRKQTNERLVPYAKPTFPLVYFKGEEQKRLNVLETDIKTYVEQMEAKFITGEASLDQWDEYVGTIEKMNIEEYVEINQAAYDRWKEAQ